MKTKSTSNHPVSADHAPASACLSPLCRSSLLLFRQQQTDLMDAAMRVFLILCLVVSLGIFGAKVTSEGRPAASKVVCDTPAANPLSLLMIPAKASRALSTVASPAF